VARVPVILVPLRLPAVTAPVTAKEDNVPTLVSEMDTTEVPRAVDVKTLTLPMRYAVPVLTTWLEWRLATETLPVTPRVPKVPTLVILGCAAVANVPMSDVADTFPLAVRFVTFKFPEMSSAPYETAPEEGFTKITFPVVAALNPVKLTPPATFREDNVSTIDLNVSFRSFFFFFMSQKSAKATSPALGLNYEC
jgi:hypothetical protein